MAADDRHEIAHRTIESLVRFSYNMCMLDLQVATAPVIDVSASWALNIVCSLDAPAPGFAGAYLRASARRRQIVHAAFAAMLSPAASNDGSGSASADEIVNTGTIWSLLRKRERQVVEAAFGCCPSGFLGALGKLGSGAHSPEFYGDLFGVFNDPEHAASASALLHLDRIHAGRLGAVKLLPAKWRLPGVVAKVDTVPAARKFLRSIELIRQWCPSANEATLDAGINRLNSDGSIASFVACWVRKTVFPQGPIASTAEIGQIRNAGELDAAALRMRNCLRDQIADILGETSAFYVIAGLARPVVAHLQREDLRAPWGLEDVYIAGNREVPAELRREAEKVLKRNGFDPDVQRERSHSDIETIRSYIWQADLERRAA